MQSLVRLVLACGKTRPRPAVRGENPVSVPLSLLDFTPAINKKVDKVAGKGLSTEDFTTAEKQKLAGIAAGANNYTHPASHPASMIAQDTTHRFVTDAEKTTWTGKASTAVATQAANGLLSAADKKKLDGIATGANNYTHPTSHPASMIATDETHLFVTAADKSAWNAKAAATAATQSAMGLMSAADKTKLDGIAAGANAYTHPASHPASMIAQDTTHRFVTDAEKTTWTGKASTAVATQAANGLLSAADKKKLDGITAGANNYTHPASHPASMIAQDTTHRFVTDTEKSAWNAKAAATAATQSAMGLMSAADKKKLDGIAAGANAYTHPTSHPASMIAQDTTHRFVTDAEKAEWNSKTGILSALHSVSYAELIALRNGKQLRPGHHYRITNFVTTVANDAEARSAAHPFDIIVLATAADTLSEEARAIVNESNAAYFATANLSAWKVWYCLDNDITRFHWADATNGRGVIYRLIDEWQNDCPYDFKNVQFKRYRASANGNLKNVINGQYYAYNGYMTGVEIENTNDFRWAYTFTLIDDDGQWRDYSITKDVHDAGTDWGYFKQFKIGRCEYNHIRNSYTAVTVDENCYRALMLNNIVLIVGIDDTGLSGEMQLNTFGDGNYNMTLKDNPEQNHFGNKCYNNIVGSFGNTLGNGCSSNTFGNNCWNNTFGNYCYSNTFGNDCADNSFGNNCWNNTFGNSCSWNSFGNDCRSNTFGNSCGRNTFGNDCWNNTFGNDCADNSFGNDCADNSFGNYLSYMTVNDGVKYVAVVGGTTTNPMRNAQILNGTSGQGPSNRLQISFRANVKYCQFAGLNSSGILKIWTPADLV